MTTATTLAHPTQPPLWPALLLACALAAPPAAHGQAVRAVTETTPYTYLKGDRVVGTATEVVEKAIVGAPVDAEGGSEPNQRADIFGIVHIRTDDERHPLAAASHDVIEARTRLSQSASHRTAMKVVAD